MLTPIITKVNKIRLNYHINEHLNIVITKEEDKIDDYAFYNKLFKNHHHLLYYMTSEQLNNIRTKITQPGTFNENAVEFLWTNQLDILLSGESLSENCYYFSHFDYTLYDNEHNIVPLPVSFGYCSSLYERVPNHAIFASIIEKLKGHPYVRSISTREIPYYNADFSGQQGIEYCTVDLPNDIYVALYAMSESSTVFNATIRCEHDSYQHYDVFGIQELLDEYYATKRYYADQDEE